MYDGYMDVNKDRSNNNSNNNNKHINNNNNVFQITVNSKQIVSFRISSRDVGYGTEIVNWMSKIKIFKE